MTLSRYGVEHVTSSENKFAEAATASTEDSSRRTREGATTPGSKGVNRPSGKVFTVSIIVFGLPLLLKRRNGPGETKRQE